MPRATTVARRLENSLSVFDRIQRDSNNIAQGCDLRLLDSRYVKANMETLKFLKNRILFLTRIVSSRRAFLTDATGVTVSPGKEGVDFLTEVLKSQHEPAAADKAPKAK